MLRSLRDKSPGNSLGRILFYEAAVLTVNAVSTVLYRSRTFGLAHVPAHGPVLLVANHQSYLDPPLIGSPIRVRHLSFIARGGLFGSRFLAWLISSFNALAISENAPDTAAIKETLRRLGEGHAVLLFPEGSRSHTGTMSEFKRGVAVLVKRAGCPVVPVAIEGAFDAWGRSMKRPRLIGARVAIMYGVPIPSAELMRDGPDAALDRLARTIDGMRLDLRARIRRATNGRYPPAGPGDGPSFPGPLTPAG